MSLPSTPPRYPTMQDELAPVVRGEVGWRPYAVEKGISFRRKDQSKLGDFGDGLEKAVKRFQSDNKIQGGADGIVGPATWFVIGVQAANAADKAAKIDLGTSLGFWVYEGGNSGASTNWSQPGGVDCGGGGLRVYGPPFAMDDADAGYSLLDAFDPKKGLLLAAKRFAKECKDILAERPGFERGDRYKKIAALGHNAPFLRNQIMRNHPPKGAAFPQDYLNTPSELARWTYNPTTRQPYTHAEWCVEYPRRILSFSL